MAGETVPNREHPLSAGTPSFCVRRGKSTVASFLMPSVGNCAWPEGRAHDTGSDLSSF